MRISVPEFVEDAPQAEASSGRRLNGRVRGQIPRNTAGGSGGTAHGRQHGPAIPDVEQAEEKPPNRERSIGLRRNRNQAASATEGASGSRRVVSAVEEPSLRTATGSRAAEGLVRSEPRENSRERAAAAAAKESGISHQGAGEEAAGLADSHVRPGRQGGEANTGEAPPGAVVRPVAVRPEGLAESAIRGWQNAPQCGGTWGASTAPAVGAAPGSQTASGGERLENSSESPRVSSHPEASAAPGQATPRGSEPAEADDAWYHRVRGILEQVNRAVNAQRPNAHAPVGGQALSAQPRMAPNDSPAGPAEQGEAATTPNGESADATEDDRSPIPGSNRSPFGEVISWGRAWTHRASGAGPMLAGPHATPEAPGEGESQADGLSPPGSGAGEQARRGRERRFSASRSISPCPAFSYEDGAPGGAGAPRNFGARQGSTRWGAAAAEPWGWDGSQAEGAAPVRSSSQRTSPPSRWPRSPSLRAPATQASMQSSGRDNEGPLVFPTPERQASTPLGSQVAAPASTFETLGHYLDSIMDAGFVSTQSSAFSHGNRPSPAPGRAEPATQRSSPEPEASPAPQRMSESPRAQGSRPPSWPGSFRLRSSQERAPEEGRGRRRSPSVSISRARYPSPRPNWTAVHDSDEDVSEAIGRSLEPFPNPFSRPTLGGSSQADPASVGTQEGRAGASGAGGSAQPPDSSELPAAASQPRIGLAFNGFAPSMHRPQHSAPLRRTRRVDRFAHLRNRPGRLRMAATLHEPRVLQAAGGPGGARQAGTAGLVPGSSGPGRSPEPGPNPLDQGVWEGPPVPLDSSHELVGTPVAQAPASQGGSAGCAAQWEQDEGSGGSAKRRKMTVGADAADLLECPVCYEIMRPPIFQCQNGHVLCSSCVGKVAQKCPSCRQVTGHIRNLALEKFAASAFISCSFSGCTASIAPQHLDAHEAQCQFRPMRCLAPHCAFEAETEQALCTHLVSTHSAKVAKLRWEESSGVSDPVLLMPHGKAFAVIEASGAAPGSCPAPSAGAEGAGTPGQGAAPAFAPAGPRFVAVLVRDRMPDSGSTTVCLVANSGTPRLLCSLFVADAAAELDQEGRRSVLETGGVPLKDACHNRQLPMGLAVPPSTGHISLWARLKLKGPA